MATWSTPSANRVTRTCTSGRGEHPSEATTVAAGTGIAMPAGVALGTTGGADVGVGGDVRVGVADGIDVGASAVAVAATTRAGLVGVDVG